jgi:acetyltransferase
MSQIIRLTANDVRDNIDSLTALLVDSVNNGASIGFLRPLDIRLAHKYWQNVTAAVGDGSRRLLIARSDAAIVGSVQLDLCMKQNGSHRAEVQKLMVLAKCRRRGIARELMNAVELEARTDGRSLLVLDTESGSDAVPFYESQLWIRIGSIPDYAMSADGVPTPNVIYCKRF